MLSTSGVLQRVPEWDEVRILVQIINNVPKSREGPEMEPLQQGDGQYANSLSLLVVSSQMALLG